MEIWNFHAGSPLTLELSRGEGDLRRLTLGMRPDGGEHPQVVVPALCWQSARPLGPWTLVGCTVAPAFTFEGFELAPDGWVPPGYRG